MSFDIFIQWFQDGEPAGVLVEQVRSTLGSALVAEDEHGWQLSFGPDCESDLYLSFVGDNDQSRVSGVTVNRPCAHEMLWEALFELMSLGNGVFYFPDARPLVRSPSAVDHLPADMVESLGEPEVVVQASALLAAIEAA